MSKMYRLNGELVEVTEEELLDAVRAEDKNYPSDLLSQMVNSCILNALAYGKVGFETAKDAKQIMTAAEESHRVLREVLEYQMRIRLEELVSEQLAEKKEDK